MSNYKQHQAINLRQLCTGYFLYSIGIKVLSLPSLLAQNAGGWSWLSALLGVFFEIVLVFIACFILKRHDKQSKFLRVLCWLLVPLTIVEIGVTTVEIYHLAYTNLFTTLGITVLVITLIALGLFFITRQPRALFRAGEILKLFFILGLILAIIPTLYNIKINWQDLVHGDLRQILPATGMNLLFFESATFVIAFGSETRKSDHELRRLNLTALLCGIGYFIFIVLFVLIFGNLSQHQTMGLVDMTTATQFITSSGSLDWLIAMSILATIILRFGMQLVAVVTLIKRGLNRND